MLSSGVRVHDDCPKTSPWEPRAEHAGHAGRCDSMELCEVLVLHFERFILITFMAMFKLVLFSLLFIICIFKCINQNIAKRNLMVVVPCTGLFCYINHGALSNFSLCVTFL